MASGASDTGSTVLAWWRRIFPGPAGHLNINASDAAAAAVRRTSSADRSDEDDVLLFSGHATELDGGLSGKLLYEMPPSGAGVEVDPELLYAKAPSTPPPYEAQKLVGTIIKSFIGSGVLFLPKAFQNGGWLFSVLIMVFIAGITNLCILRLIKCREVVIGSYGFVGHKAAGRLGQVAVDTSLVLSQTGFCCVYVVFIARNVLQLLNAWMGCTIEGHWLWLFIVLQWPVFTLFTWIRRLASFSHTNLLADAIIFSGLLGILAYSFHGISNATTGPSIELFNSSEFSLFLGTAVYAFEGIGMVVPVYDSLSPPAQKRFPFILSATLFGIAGVYIIVGLVPYVYFDGIAHVPLQDAITLNLPRVWWSYLIQGGYCVALMFSYPLMLFPALKIMEKAMTPGFLRPGGTTKWRRNAFRSFVVACTLCVSLLGSEQLNNFVALVGCFCCTPLAFIYPCLFHLKLIRAGWLSRAVDVAIIIFGIGVFCFSTYEAIAQWTVSIIQPCVTV